MSDLREKDKEGYDCVAAQLPPRQAVDEKGVALFEDKEKKIPKMTPYTPEDWMDDAWEGKKTACRLRANPMHFRDLQNTKLKEEINALKRAQPKE